MSNRSHILALVLLLPAAVVAQPAAPKGEYLRLVENDSGEAVSLQAPIVSFEPVDGEPEGLRVDLVGAIHVADASFYSTLNERFTGYDAVLYELVAPEGASPQPNAAPRNVVSGLQMGITRLLDLTFQLDQVDYSQANFVHADLTPEALAQSMSDRGESIMTYLSRLLTASADQESMPLAAVGGGGMLAILFSPDRARLLKTLFARSILDIENFSRIIEGESGSSLVGARNARAVEVLKDRIRRGDRHIAIFYGVAHLPDLASRLESDIGLTESGVSWIDAWDLQETMTP